MDTFLESLDASDALAEKYINDLADKYGLNISKFNIQELIMGYNVELEHGSESKYNITNNDPLMTLKIALAHLEEDETYYSKLKTIEDDFMSSDFDNIKESLDVATPTNTLGMGNITAPTANSDGSGDILSLDDKDEVLKKKKKLAESGKNCKKTKTDKPTKKIEETKTSKKVNTVDFEPPKYAIKPQDDDNLYKFVRDNFRKQTFGSMKTYTYEEFLSKCLCNNDDVKKPKKP